MQVRREKKTETKSRPAENSFDHAANRPFSFTPGDMDDGNAGTGTTEMPVNPPQSLQFLLEPDVIRHRPPFEIGAVFKKTQGGFMLVFHPAIIGARRA